MQDRDKHLCKASRRRSHFSLTSEGGGILPQPPHAFATAFQEAYACGKDLCCPGKPADHKVLLSLLREVDTLCEDERIMGLLPCVLDGYAWVLGVLAGTVSASVQAEREQETCS